jgi:serine/threonine protein kinase
VNHFSIGFERREVPPDTSRRPSLLCPYLTASGSPKCHGTSYCEEDGDRSNIDAWFCSYAREWSLIFDLSLVSLSQVAAGLSAVHKERLVHRDIKPSNIMVSLEEGGAVTAKIIDLGLAKSLDEPGAQTAISTPGAFAGTPEFASPEQFAGLPVDIRSDLYSLGVTLWEMVTGNAPFRGTPGAPCKPDRPRLVLPPARRCANRSYARRYQSMHQELPDRQAPFRLATIRAP